MHPQNMKTDLARCDARLNRSRSSGLTLVEILIALLVISVGLLGVAGLHSLSLRNNYDALMRSHASALAADIADRMRANRAAAAEYVLPLTTTSVTVAADSPISTIDLSQWRAALAATLPQGTGAVAMVPAASGPGGVATITIQWGERDDVNPVQFVTETEI